ncbi:lysophospholipid acyltransferase family protein [Salipaludibacillus aurantiacus]|uniref:1-acyl-sn-glycerol-3-phosphate acyltransferase n=1 Tax=Salipaludibacillus aurantiacus TaxID=1601833 RepID=A0A1H9PGW9_9BACI|nr:lysophospholipid acyltransferase family protein [Salipaludibacillus aurantiacus]SER47109.1 1-acyl-sn-glycerol-3-phosphate acyltransferase [Salipaludibacillus aurantiacus]
MIKAERKKAFEHIFHQYNRLLIKKSFNKVFITKNSYMPSSASGGLYLINHSSWWDGLFLFYLNQRLLKLDGIAMMGEDGLKRFPFFRKLGAFSVNPSSKRSLMESLTYASDELNRGKHLFLFPQGEETHLEKRPLSFFSGAAYLHDKNSDIPVIPVTFYHGLFHHQLPDWYIHIGKPLNMERDMNRHKKTKLFEDAVTFQLGELKQTVVNGQFKSFNVLLRGKQGIGQRWEYLKTWFKGGK